MTTLTKPRTVKVQTAGLSLVVQLDPSGMIRMREPRRRTWLDIPLARVYYLAAQDAADNIRAERASRRRGER